MYNAYAEYIFRMYVLPRGLAGQLLSSNLLNPVDSRELRLMTQDSEIRSERRVEFRIGK